MLGDKIFISSDSDSDSLFLSRVRSVSSHSEPSRISSHQHFSDIIYAFIYYYLS